MLGISATVASLCGLWLGVSEPIILWPSQYDLAMSIARDAKLSRDQRIHSLSQLLRPENPRLGETIAWSLGLGNPPELTEYAWAWCLAGNESHCRETALQQVREERYTESNLAVLRNAAPMQALEIFQDWLSSDDAELRNLAVEQLAYLPASGPIDQPRALLLDVIARESGDLRRLAVHKLGERGKGAGVHEVLECLLDLDANLRLAALSTLGRLGDEAAALALFREMWLPADTESRRTALHSLIEIPGEVSSAMLVDLLQHPPPELTRIELVTALRERQQPSNALIDVLAQQLIQSPHDPDERVAILETLERYGPRTAQTLRRATESRPALASMMGKPLASLRTDSTSSLHNRNRQTDLAGEAASQAVPSRARCNALELDMLDAASSLRQRLLAYTVWLRCPSSLERRSQRRRAFQSMADFTFVHIASAAVDGIPATELVHELKTAERTDQLATTTLAVAISRPDIDRAAVWSAFDRVTHPTWRSAILAALTSPPSKSQVLIAAAQADATACRVVAAPPTPELSPLRWFFCDQDDD